MDTTHTIMPFSKNTTKFFCVPKQTSTLAARTDAGKVLLRPRTQNRAHLRDAGNASPSHPHSGTCRAQPQHLSVPQASTPSSPCQAAGSPVLLTTPSLARCSRCTRDKNLSNLWPSSSSFPATPRCQSPRHFPAPLTTSPPRRFPAPAIFQPPSRLPARHFSAPQHRSPPRPGPALLTGAVLDLVRVEPHAVAGVEQLQHRPAGNSARRRLPAVTQPA